MALKEDVSRRGARTLAAGQFRCFRYRTKVSVNAVTFIVILAACAVQFVSGFSWYQPPSTTPKVFSTIILGKVFSFQLSFILAKKVPE